MDQQVAVLLHLVNQQYEETNEIINVLYGLINDNTYMDNIAIILTYREQHFRIPHYAEEWLVRYINYDFFSLIRMTRDSFNTLLRDIKCEEIHKDFIGGNQPISSEKLLLMTLWWLGKGEVLASVADRFNISLSAVHSSTELILDLILGLLDNYIMWPSAEELLAIEVNFRDRAGFPGVIGAIDGCNVKFKAPYPQQDSYIDRKMQHSIKLQGIVIASKIFTIVMVRFPGSAHDARVFTNSGIFIDVEQRGKYRKYFPFDEYHLVGDSAYPLLKWMLKPYKDNGVLNARRRNFNTKLSQTRIVVEHTFGLLKSRWRILTYVNVNSIKKAFEIITACCVLHNFCYMNNDPWNEYIPLPEDVEAQNKRETIAAQLAL